MTAQTQKNMSELALNAGLGAASLSRIGWAMAYHYHLLLGALTASVLLFIGIASQRVGMMAALTVAYVLYLLGLRAVKRSDRARATFYSPLVQAIRAQLIIVSVTALLMLTGPLGMYGGIWVLYALAIQLSSRHGPSWTVALVAVESGAAIFLMNGFYLLTPSDNLDLYQSLALSASQSCVLVMLAFMLHYLIRNIDARDATIQAQRLVTSLASRLESVNGPGQWRHILDVCLKALSAQRAMLWKSDPSGPGFTLMAGLEANDGLAVDLETPTSRSLDPSAVETVILEEVLRRGEMVYQVVRPTDAPAKSQPLTHPFGSTGVHSWLGAPILDAQRDGGPILGVLGFEFCRPATLDSQILQEHQLLLANLAPYLKPLLGSYDRVEEAMALQTVWRRLSEGTALDQVLNALAEILIKPVGFEFAAVSLVDDDERSIRMVTGVNIPRAWINMSNHSLDSGDIQADVIRTGRMEILEGWDRRFDRAIYDQFEHADMVRVFAPIHGPGARDGEKRAIGTIEAGYRQKRGDALITPRQLRMLNQVIDQASIAIEWARLLQQQNTKAQALESLSRVGQVIRNQRQLPRVLDEIGQSAERVLKADFVMLYVRSENEADGLLSPRVYGDIWGKPHFNLDLNRPSILGQLIRDPKPIFASDVDTQNDPGYALLMTGKPNRPKSFPQSQHVKSMAALPLVANGRVVGLLFVNYRRRHQFTADEQLILKLFAQTAASAIRDANVNDRLRRATIIAERSRLSRELHDSIAQHVPAIRLFAESAAECAATNPQKTQELLGKIVAAAEAVQRELRHHVFRPEAGDREIARLPAGLEELRRRSQDRFGLPVDLQIEAYHEMSPSLEAGLYAIACEAMANVNRHAGATTACIALKEEARRICLSITDNGIGFDPTLIEAPSSIGLHGMRERAAELGGSLEVVTQPGAGTLIRVIVPLDKDQD